MHLLSSEISIFFTTQVEHVTKTKSVLPCYPKSHRFNKNLLSIFEKPRFSPWKKPEKQILLKKPQIFHPHSSSLLDLILSQALLQLGNFVGKFLIDVDMKFWFLIIFCGVTFDIPLLHLSTPLSHL